MLSDNTEMHVYLCNAYVCARALIPFSFCSPVQTGGSLIHSCHLAFTKATWSQANQINPLLASSFSPLAACGARISYFFKITSRSFKKTNMHHDSSRTKPTRATLHLSSLFGLSVLGEHRALDGAMWCRICHIGTRCRGESWLFLHSHEDSLITVVKKQYATAWIQDLDYAV